MAIHADKIMINTQHSKYPFVEGDEYYTLDKYSDMILSVWDEESEAIHEDNPELTYYFVFRGRLWKKHLRFPSRDSIPDTYLYYQSAI